jgi:hypothetical protein
LHPLTLRIFCEVTNPERKKVVGVGAMPTSLTGLYQKYLEDVAKQVALSFRSKRYYEPEVREALSKIGIALWETQSREIDIAKLRIRLGDNGSWDHSILRALESSGVLLRHPFNGSMGYVSILYDAMAGHVIADALFDKFGGSGFAAWLSDDKTLKILTGPDRHPLAEDIFSSLIGLTPRRTPRQLWPLLTGELQDRAIYGAAYLESAYLDRDTVEKLLIFASSGDWRKNLFHRLFVTRADPSHPLNANFLHRVLHPMAVADRDLHWSQWMRREKNRLIKSVQELEKRWERNEERGEADALRARWLMWTLTSTIRFLRDLATRALYRFGCNAPEELFEMAVESLGVNDPYVPERMLAACYGVAMARWADPKGIKVRSALLSLANTLVESMFVIGAQYHTYHALTKGYAWGLISLASQIDENFISKEKWENITQADLEHPSSFSASVTTNDPEIEKIGEEIHRDFEKDNIGKLIPGWYEYHYEHPYKKVRR